ncbi:RNA-directed DNA polymerase [Blautia marasmi]|uniref:RNA-directed DNA polymerase n=1 Tax=Blautia marasmi TaxID=1917868 RepID=UPI000CF24173|nr:RNA-directed DNA polymerase [Blautia marasmi]
MKMYKDFMYEITADKLYESLLAYGMFSEKLPPFLTSKQFYEYCQCSGLPFADKPSQFVYYENMRNINIPRPLGIPTPMSYQRLCKCLKDNWRELQEYFNNMTINQSHKVSRIHIRNLKDKKHIFEMNYSNWRLDPGPEEDLLIGNYYMVCADISKCFPSIYTHSIPWALVGKSSAKKSRRSGWFNDLDRYIQNTKYGETHGILIGPHASNLISEIVLSAIDNRLVDKGWKYIRNIDDYTCYVRSEQDARQFLIDLQTELREYDLSLNHKKTKVRELPLDATEHWVRKINSISVLTSYGKVDYKNCRAYLDFAIEISKNEGENSSVLNYAMQVLKGKELTYNAKKYLQKTAFHLCLIYPYLIPLLEECVFSFCNTPVMDIEQISNKLYDMCINCRTFEVGSYALYFAIKYSFTLSGVKYTDIINSKDCVLMLLGSKYFEYVGDKVAHKELKNHAKQLSKDIDDFNQYWLFVYEVLPMSNLKDDWKPLKKAGVSFIKNKW